jgi:hypothetical protein
MSRFCSNLGKSCPHGTIHVFNFALSVTKGSLISHLFVNSSFLFVLLHLFQYIPVYIMKAIKPLLPTPDLFFEITWIIL